MRIKHADCALTAIPCNPISPSLTTLQFTSPEDAMSFMEYLNLAATCGNVLVECFKQLDRNQDK